IYYDGPRSGVSQLQRRSAALAPPDRYIPPPPLPCVHYTGVSQLQRRSDDLASPERYIPPPPLHRVHYTGVSQLQRRSDDLASPERYIPPPPLHRVHYTGVSQLQRRSDDLASPERYIQRSHKTNRWSTPIPTALLVLKPVAAILRTSRNAKRRPEKLKNCSPRA
ncbi:hypothetical protein J6590_002987, partial [Homalodisca vitripennis]